MKSKSALKGVLGLGSSSTGYYLIRIHEKYNRDRDEFSTCPLLLYQIDFQEINPYLPNQFPVLIPLMKKYFSEICDLRISKVLVPNITLHETLDQMELPLEIIHPVNLTLDHLQKSKIQQVCLFGTLYTMNSHYLKSKFQTAEISLLKPTESDQIEMDDFRKKVYDQSESQLDIENFQNLIRKYSGENPVVIACTELSVYAIKNNSFCIDMAELQIEAFLK